jgi:hypothetical protein
MGGSEEGGADANMTGDGRDFYLEGRTPFS